MILEFCEVENNGYFIIVETNNGTKKYNMEDYISNI